MVKYLTNLHNLRDPIVNDGTTGFAMALARQDLDLIKILLASNHPCDVNPTKLAKRAVLELDMSWRYPEKDYGQLKKELVNALKELNLTPSRLRLRRMNSTV